MEKWKYFAVISMFFAGLTSVLAKFGMKNLHSDFALFIRSFIVFGFVCLHVILFQNVFLEWKNISKTNLLFLILSGFTTTLSWLFYYRAIKIGPVSHIASIDKGSILVTILLSFLFLNEPFSMKILFGAGFILIGLIILTCS